MNTCDKIKHKAVMILLFLLYKDQQKLEGKKLNFQGPEYRGSAGVERLPCKFNTWHSYDSLSTTKCDP